MATEKVEATTNEQSTVSGLETEQDVLNSQREVVTPKKEDFVCVFDEDKFNKSLKAGEELAKKEEDDKVFQSFGINPDEPLSQASMRGIEMMLKEMRKAIEVCEDIWNQSKKTFRLRDEHMRKLYAYNEEHRVPMPEDTPEEYKDAWDPYNGLDDIPEDVVLEIFGEDHPIIGVAHSVTKDRIKDVFADFFNWLAALREHNEAERGYHMLLDMSQTKEIEKLRVIMDAKETSPEQKAGIKQVLDQYENFRYLDYFTNPVDTFSKKKIIEAFGDAKRVEYSISRTRDILTKLHFNSKFILEISQFEKRFLCERYHKMSNILLLYVMNNIIYSNTGDRNSIDAKRIDAMIMSLDYYVRNVYDEETKKRIKNNIMDLLDQFIDDVHQKYFPDTPIIPRDELDALESETKEDGTNDSVSG